MARSFLGILSMFMASLSLTGLWSGKRDVSHVEAAEEKLLDQPFIRVIGTGKVTAVPDEAVLTIGLLFRAFLQKIRAPNTWCFDAPYGMLSGEGYHQKRCSAMITSNTKITRIIPILLLKKPPP
ncbi:MAG: hypothetical protein BAA01_00875 [Bacillus thermozeamaize]|uniref:Uncharacterized protein n=1 Tax=Bacillus thermozeamaize TaxID=230954 RepID=A0A1Y3PE03_9BACI|nr:MAG: hypothetical protein BAA01_00875 [Bacillus thermozeamaize]